MTVNAAPSGQLTIRTTALDRVRASANRPWSTIVIALSIAAVSTLISFVRLPEEARLTIWAEDGTFFLQDQINSGAGSVLDPYQGYLHVVPRLLAGIGLAIAPLDHFAVIITALSCLTAGMIAAGIYVLSGQQLRSSAARILIALIPAFAPMVPYEISGNVANLHWYFLFLGPWLFLYVPRNWFFASSLAVVAALAALTEPQLLMFAPLLFVHIRQRRTWPTILAVVIGLSAQVLTSVLYPRTGTKSPPVEMTPSDVAVGFVLEPFVGSWWGNTREAAHSAFEGWLGWLWVAFGAAIVILILGMIFGTSRERLVIVALSFGAVVSWSAALLLNPQPFLRFAFDTEYSIEGFGMTRYAQISSMFILAALVAAASTLPWKVPWLLVRVLVPAVVIAGAVMSFLPQTDQVPRAWGPQWQLEVDVARQDCESGADHVSPQVAPGGWWVVTMPCQRAVP